MSKQGCLHAAVVQIVIKYYQLMAVTGWNNIYLGNVVSTFTESLSLYDRNTCHLATFQFHSMDIHDNH